MTKKNTVVIAEGKNQSVYSMLPGQSLLIRRQDAVSSGEVPSHADAAIAHVSGSPYISQRHALVRYTEDGRVLIKDLDSANGTYLRLPSFQEFELDENSQAMLAQDLVVQLSTTRWERLPDVGRFATAADFVGYLRTQLGEAVESIKVYPADSPEALQQKGPHLRQSLLATGEYLIVKWQHTLNRAIERWVQACAAMFNSGAPREPMVGEETPWEFTAVSHDRRTVRQLARRVALTSSTVLLVGPTGTGKDVLARDIHRHSARAKGPFIAVNCAAVPKELFEAELFGALRGSYTGCTTDRMGLFERAANGTLFLDEIGDLPFDLQAKLLRALDTRRIRRVGESTEERPISARIVAATNLDLEAMVAAGKFRAELFFRLNAVQLTLSPLTQADVRALVPILAQQLPREEFPELPLEEIEQVAELASELQWEGNARDLKNAIIRYATFREPGRSAAENWRTVLAMSQGIRMSSSPPPADSAPWQIEVTPDMMQISKHLDALIFLHAARQKLFPKQRGAIAKLGEMLAMTGAGVSARLERLKIDTTDPDPNQIEQLIGHYSMLLAPYHAFLHGLLGM